MTTEVKAAEPAEPDIPRCERCGAELVKLNLSGRVVCSAHWDHWQDVISTLPAQQIIVQNGRLPKIGDLSAKHRAWEKKHAACWVREEELDEEGRPVIRMKWNAGYMKALPTSGPSRKQADQPVVGPLRAKYDEYVALVSPVMPPRSFEEWLKTYLERQTR